MRHAFALMPAQCFKLIATRSCPRDVHAPPGDADFRTTDLSQSGEPAAYDVVTLDEAGLVQRVLLQDAAGLLLVGDVADVDALAHVGERSGRAQQAGLPQSEQVAHALDEER